MRACSVLGAIGAVKLKIVGLQMTTRLSGAC